ncbi:hypothetical protein [Citrobacter portucalensis]|uniref:hypothetical protein n=1 Tax=Citrobacter portucalensis TaxID=1639133 RepID=UPI0018A350CE|nr:hypothetical protein [Citrobacter portucalensis]BBV41352.1 hypothetical protein STW0522CIT26_28240 [Citrobacter portucalensis]BBV46333.1 hypothetical protein STW0522CIT27_27730 [Citrobacter portucalensis]BBV51615.1 hypothetical protein STW0522CIT30_28750 [Citrobacter portucalensis]BBW12347.1 hypothetical protein STN0717CIT27_28230 [Citrobacter portucalensis]BBW17399.1 hypothetical protein STN0717CIT36_28230 [Citrobacter portucalensis]
MLDFIKDIYISFRRTSLERVKSPVLGAFVFSWLGFNWQLLLILAKSKNAIEDTIKTINNDFDIVPLLIGPMFTTALICLLLPLVNKYVTKLQDAPNADTIIMNLSAKIKMAEFQQTIAETEAKIKLSEKREERFIEEEIQKIKHENANLTITNKKNIAAIEGLEKKLNESMIESSRLDALLEVEKNMTKKLNQNLESLKTESTKLFTENLTRQTEISNINSQLHNTNSILDKKTLEAKNLTDDIENYKKQMETLVERYPEIFSTVTSMDGKTMLAINETKIKDINATHSKLLDKNFRY